MRTFKSMIILIISIVLINAFLWIGRQDYQEARRKQARADRYEIMIENAMQGNHEKNREFLGGGLFE